MPHRALDYQTLDIAKMQIPASVKLAHEAVPTEHGAIFLFFAPNVEVGMVALWLDFQLTIDIQ